MFQISHSITYEYSQPVTLLPHKLRLRPQCSGQQSVTQFALQISPTPLKMVDVRDLDGNDILQVWFEAVPVQKLQIQSQVQVISHLSAPFDYLLEPWAVKLPIDYPHSVWQRLQPYLQGYLGGVIDPVATQLGAELWSEHQGIGNFLNALNQKIYQSCEYLLRIDGLPWPPGVTWSKKSGSCRDLAVLFIEVCRSVGVAARFVSGYEAGVESPDRYLHAWVEVFLPGAGWRGYDPTHGLVVADDHIVLATAPRQQQTMPVEGQVQGKIVSETMTDQLLIQKS
jgi:transglutaminase-like putative cysteine protease